MEEVVSDTKKNMDKSFDSLQSDLKNIKTGKASNQMVENIEVNAYGGSARLKIMELATISVPDSNTIIITPFDLSVLGEIEKAINDSGLGINPVVTDNVIRLTVPPLTEERRSEMVKLINQKCENGKIMIRQNRQEAMQEIKKIKDEGHTSEDDVSRTEKEVQNLTDEYIKYIDELREHKEKELMTV